MIQCREWILEIAGMTCGNCAHRVDDALRTTPGVIECLTKYPDCQTLVVADASVDGAILAGTIAAQGCRVVGHSVRIAGDRTVGG